MFFLDRFTCFDIKVEGVGESGVLWGSVEGRGDPKQV